MAQKNRRRHNAPKRRFKTNFVDSPGQVAPDFFSKESKKKIRKFSSGKKHTGANPHGFYPESLNGQSVGACDRANCRPDGGRGGSNFGNGGDGEDPRRPNHPGLTLSTRRHYLILFLILLILICVLIFSTAWAL
ncbi:uncharacterized protein LOC132201015 [Neocloeon triangulifer]|uniref:uncharacterized protein LOC132201015 n=1 Tax=Neocloeon triangulifer TaxID=2078957 RepID=UPI00286F0619|nr:uncharacterized protein LOC132201015 [Neocloeon triangulifer]